MRRLVAVDARPISMIGVGESEIRQALANQLHRQYANDPETRFLSELGICRGRVRVDLAVVNGTLHGYEIKSDRDSLRRLGRQAEVYGHVLEFATLVVGGRYADQVTAILPWWWEIMRASGDFGEITFECVRSGQSNPSRDARALVELVWLDRALQMLEARDAIRGFRGKPRHVVWDRVCQIYSVDEIAAVVREHLKARTALAGPPPLE